MTASGWTRRGFLGATAAAGRGLPLAPALGAASSRRRPDGRLPGRGDFVIRRAYVLSMDDDVGDVADADVHVRDGVIVDVGPDLRTRAPSIDGRRSIVLPGLIDTHWHMWTTLHRALAPSRCARPGRAGCGASRGSPTVPSSAGAHAELEAAAAAPPRR